MRRKSVKPAQRSSLKESSGAPKRKYVLPTSRALIGALLITLSVVGVVAAVALSRKDPRTSYLVVNRDIGVGEVLGAEDVDLVLADLPASVRSGLFNDPHAVEGAVTIAPISQGGLVAGSALMDGERAGRMEVSIEISKARALNGRLQRGERVDVLSTLGQGRDTVTEVAANDVIVANIDEVTSGIGSDGDLVLTLAFPIGADVRSFVNATDSGDVSIVRSGQIPVVSSQDLAETESDAVVGAAGGSQPGAPGSPDSTLTPGLVPADPDGLVGETPPEDAAPSDEQLPALSPDPNAVVTP